jgi:hypothetical protein
MLPQEALKNWAKTKNRYSHIPIECFSAIEILDMAVFCQLCFVRRSFGSMGSARLPAKGTSLNN